MPITGNKIDLYDLQPKGYTFGEYEGGIYVQSLDQNGSTVPNSQYYWYDDDLGAVWCDGNDNEIEPGQVQFGIGEALWTNAENADESIQTAGQVASGWTDVYLRSGFKFINNPTPVAIPFNDDNGDGKFIQPSGYTFGIYEGTIYTQKLDKNGSTVPNSQCYWYDDELGAVWCDGNDNELVGVTLAPGEALWVAADNTEEKISFPGVDIK